MAVTASVIRTPYTYEQLNTNGNWFGIYSSSYNLTDFNYVFTIYSNSLTSFGLTATTISLGSFKVPPSPDDAIGWFSPHRILKSKLTTRLNYGLTKGSTQSTPLWFDNSPLQYSVNYGCEWNPYTAFYRIKQYSPFTNIVIEFNSAPDLQVNDVIRINKTNPQYNGEINTFGYITSMISATQAQISLSPTGTLYNDTGRITYVKRMIGSITQSNSAFFFDGSNAIASTKNGYNNYYKAQLTSGWTNDFSSTGTTWSVSTGFTQSEAGYYGGVPYLAPVYNIINHLYTDVKGISKNITGLNEDTPFLFENGSSYNIQTQLFISEGAGVPHPLGATATRPGATATIYFNIGSSVTSSTIYTTANYSYEFSPGNFAWINYPSSYWNFNFNYIGTGSNNMFSISASASGNTASVKIISVKISEIGSTNDNLYGLNGIRSADKPYYKPTLYNINGSNPFLTSLPNRDIFLNQYDSIWFLANGNTASELVSNVKIDLVGSAGTITATYSTYMSNWLLRNPEARLWSLSCGTNEIAELTGNSLALINKIIFTITTGSGVTQSFYRNIVENCSPYELIRLAFLNKWGGWDFFNFNRLSKYDATITRTESKQPLKYNTNFTNNKSNGQNILTTIKSDEVYTINTDWVTEEEYSLLQELIESPMVYIVDSLSYKGSKSIFNTIEPQAQITPIIITNTAFNKKKQINDTIFNLTITYKKAFDKINHMK